MSTVLPRDVHALPADDLIGRRQDDAVDSVFQKSTIVFNGETYSVECINSVAGVKELEADWRALEETSREMFSYFQSFDWCHQWAQQFADADGTKLKIVAIRFNGKLVMIWPLASVVSRAKVRVLTFLSEPLGQYSNILAIKGHASVELGQRVYQFIKEDRDFDAFVVANCPVDSLLQRIIGQDGIEETKRPVSSILDLAIIPDWEEYHKSLPKSARKERNRRRNKLESLGEVTYEIEPAGSERYRELVAKCLSFKKVWLEETGRRAGILGEVETQEFFSGLASSYNGDKLEAGSVIHCLCVDGEPVGFELGMVWKNDYYSYLGAINWDWRQYSPGKVQMEYAQKWAKENGYKRFDFLSDPSDYKANWTNDKQELVSLSIPVSVSGYVYCKVWKAIVKPRMKQVYHQTGAANREHFNRLFALIGLGKK